jgi:hypothetical protein
MAKKKKFDPKGPKVKVTLPKNQMDKLKGFEDVIDVFLQEQEQKDSESCNISFDKGHDNYSLYDFLDLERKRLSKIESFLSVKIPNIKTHNQSKIILKNQQDRKFQLREEVIKRIKTNNSSFVTQMRMIFDQSFKG